MSISINDILDDIEKENNDNCQIEFDLINIKNVNHSLDVIETNIAIKNNSIQPEDLIKSFSLSLENYVCSGCDCSRCVRTNPNDIEMRSFKCISKCQNCRTEGRIPGKQYYKCCISRDGSKTYYQSKENYHNQQVNGNKCNYQFWSFDCLNEDHDFGECLNCIPNIKNEIHYTEIDMISSKNLINNTLFNDQWAVDGYQYYLDKLGLLQKKLITLEKK